MTYDRPGDVGPNGQVPEGVRLAFKALGILAALGLAVIAVLLIALEVQQHGDRQTAQRNESAVLIVPATTPAPTLRQITCPAAGI